MNVLYLTNNPNLGSTARILQSWLRIGRSTGLEASVVVQKEGDLSRWLSNEGIPHLVDPMPWFNKRWPLPSVWHAMKVARWARRREVRIVHCNEHDVYPFALLLRRFLRVPVVCHARFRVEEGFGRWAFAKHAPEALLWTSQQQKHDSAAAVSGMVAEDRQHVVSLGLDLKTFGILSAGRDTTRKAWGLRPDEIAVGTASALRPIKRIEDFVELVARLTRKDDRVVGVLAGDAVAGGESYREKILQQIRETGLGRRFVWTGHLEPIEPFYHAIDIFVSTSEYETFGNSVCEAMACGKPVAAYRGGSVAEVLGEAGAIVENADLEGLTFAVEAYVRDPERRAESGRRGSERVVEKFDPAQSFKQVRELYDRIDRTASEVGL